MRYFIDGCYGDENLGDECLLDATIELIRTQDSSAEFVVCSDQPELTTARTGLPSVAQFNPWGPGILRSLVSRGFRETLRALRSCDVFVIGGGELIRDDFGFRSCFGAFWRSNLAKLLGRKVWLLGLGACTPESKAGRLWLRNSLRLADTMTCRDRHSLKIVQELLGRNCRASLSPDLVFSMAPSIGETSAADEITIGLSWKALPHGHRLANDRWTDVRSSVIDGLQRFAGANPCHLKLIAFQPSELPELRSIQSQLSDCGLTSQIEIPADFRSAEQLFRSCDFTINMPFHGSVISLISETPSIGLAYDLKVSRLYEAANTSEFCFDLNNSLTGEWFENRFRTLKNADFSLSDETLKWVERQPQAWTSFFDSAPKPPGKITPSGQIYRLPEGAKL